MMMVQPAVQDASWLCRTFSRSLHKPWTKLQELTPPFKSEIKGDDLAYTRNSSVFAVNSPSKIVEGGNTRKGLKISGETTPQGFQP